MKTFEFPMYLEPNIQNMTIEEREEVFVDIARILDRTALEAMVEGNQRFAIFSMNMAEAIRLNADELARDDLLHAEKVMKQATDLVRQFKAIHPYGMQSHSIH